MTNFEIATRVPFIIAAPGIAPARTRNLAELVDLYPTLCDLTGLKPPRHLEGESLLPVLKEPAEQITSMALSQHERYRERFMGRALRTDDHRYVAWFEKKTGRVVERELYDHRTDPLETRNIAGNPAQANLVKQLHRQLESGFKLR